MEGVWPDGVTNSVAASLYRLETRRVKSWGRKKVKYADQLAMVHRGEGTLKIKIAEDHILLVGVSVLHTEAEVGNRSRTGAVGPETFLFLAEDLASLYVVGS
jgi:hypothetical protein